MGRGNNTFKTMEFTSGGVCKNAVSDNIVTKEFADELNNGFSISVKTIDKNKSDLPCGCNSYILNKEDVSKAIEKDSANQYKELDDSIVVNKRVSKDFDNLVVKEVIDEAQARAFTNQTMNERKLADIKRQARNGYNAVKQEVKAIPRGIGQTAKVGLLGSAIVGAGIYSGMNTTDKGFSEKLKSEPGMIESFVKNHPIATTGVLALGGSDTANRLQDRRREKLENKNIVAKELDDSTDIDMVDKCAGSSFPIVKKRP